MDETMMRRVAAARAPQDGGEFVSAMRASFAVAHAITPCPLGYLLVAATPRGLCTVGLGDSEDELEVTMGSRFPAAQLAQDSGKLDQWVASLQDYLHGRLFRLDLPLDVRATVFQSRVWQALREIPYGSTRTYSDLAQAIGQPAAARAVGRACAANPVALVIPCHRAVREDGGLAGYRWGIERKEALLALEETEAGHATASDQRDAEMHPA